jgi:diguanylate cyclase
MAQHYHPGLVLLSLLVAILASYTALTLALRIRVAARPAAPAWLLGGGFVMGVGIWAMHFVGMLALTLPLEIAYNVGVTLFSLLIAIAVSTFALHVAGRAQVRRSALVVAGIAMGVGICSMHYVGMAAIEIAPPIRYDALWVAASFAIAIAASFAALGVAFTERADSGWWRYRRFAGAVGMGFAITGMHYAGMFAAQFPELAVSSATRVDKDWLAGSVATITLFVLIAALLLSLVEARAARMQASLAQAKESSRAKDEFLAMLGHELRNPLAAISNAVYVLQHGGGRGSEDWRIARDVIARQSQHLAHIVDDLLDVGRAIAGKMSLQRRPLDLDLAVREALSALHAAGKTVERRIEYHGSSAWVDADRTRIEQLISNLVSNAVQHTTAGGRIALHVAPGAGAAGAAVTLTVRDDGVGMDAETAARAFELFFQARQEPARKKGGLGVGLTLARRIAELHGGSIEAASDGPGKGTTFTVVLPMVAAPRAAEPVRADAALRGARRVVIVEDAPDARLSLQLVLENAGHEVHAAEDGPSGFDAIVRLRPDVAFIDIGLPGLDGCRLAERLRASGVRTCLVALTGYGLDEDRQRTRDAGFDSHLAKPPQIPQLLKLVADAPAGVRTLFSRSDAKLAKKGS